MDWNEALLVSRRLAPGRDEILHTMRCHPDRAGALEGSYVNSAPPLAYAGVAILLTAAAIRNGRKFPHQLIPPREDIYTLEPGPNFYRDFLRAAELARRLASALCSRLTWEIENFNDRASLRQVQFREYRRGLRQAYTPVICFTTTSESE